jgi:DNA invertase Pin-like site-specific DNA recombinase
LIRAIEGNAGNGALVLRDVHGPAGVLLGALAHQISDHLLAKGERLTVVDQRHAAERVELGKLLKRLDEGDVLVVTRLDRLARSTRDLLNILDKVAKAGAGFRSLADTWADTTTPHGRLMLTILGGLAEFERELIRARTGEGRARAKAAGVHMGRPPKLTQHQRREAMARREAGEALTEIARTFNVSHSTISRLTQ